MATSDLQDRLQVWLRQLNANWDERWLGVQVRKLPPTGDALRLPALVELVKIDLRQQWQHGKHVRIEAYLKVLPELGTPQTVQLDLLRTEIEVCQRHGVPPELEQLLRRFPDREAEIRLLFSQETLSAGDAVGAQTQ